MKSLHVIFLAGVCLLFAASCQYHWGRRVSPQVSRIFVDEVRNETLEEPLARLLRSALTEQVSAMPGMRLETAAEQATCHLDATVKSIQKRSAGRAELRDAKARQKDSDAYQTVLYRVEVRVAFALHDKEGTELLSRDVVGTADAPRMHDLGLAYQAAYRQALDDAARQIVDAIVGDDSPEGQEG